MKVRDRLRGPVHLGASPTDGENAGFVELIVNRRADRILESPLGIGGEIDRDCNSRGNSSRHFDVGHHRAVHTARGGGTVVRLVDADAI